MTNIGLPAIVIFTLAALWLIAAGRKRARSKGDLTFAGAFMEVAKDLMRRISHAIVGGDYTDKR